MPKLLKAPKAKKATAPAAKTAKPIPDGFHTVTPYLVVNGAADAIAFYKKAFGAKELCRMPAPDGKRLMHAEILIGNSIVMLGDKFEGCCGEGAMGTSVSMHLYVEDVDKAFKQAVSAGAQVKMPITDMFWGDRYGQIVDPFGHAWGIATHVKDVTPQQMAKAAQEAFSQPQGCCS